MISIVISRIGNNRVTVIPVHSVIPANWVEFRCRRVGKVQGERVVFIAARRIHSAALGRSVVLDTGHLRERSTQVAEHIVVYR